MLVRSKVPLRLGFAGGGTDVSPYCDQYGGTVLNATIDMYAYCTIEALDENIVHFIALDRDEEFQAEASSELPFDGHLDLHKGVYNRIIRQFTSNTPLGCRITTSSDAPAGSGLGSSSTMVVAILTAMKEWLSLPLGEYDVAHMAFEIERMEVNLAGGRQDQYAATFGGFNFMEFYSDDRVIVNPLRVKNWIINELNTSMVLYYTGVSRASANIIDEQIERVKQNDNDSLQATHKLKQDASDMKEALLKGDIRYFGEILNRSWKTKQALASKISNSEIETLIHTASSAGAYAGKVSGAGGGGFIMFMVDPNERVSLIRELKQQHGDIINFHFEKNGAQAWRIA